MPYVKDQEGNKRTWRIKGLGYNWDNNQVSLTFESSKHDVVFENYKNVTRLIKLPM